MAQSTTLRAIPFLFDRPSEPLFLPRDNVTFDVPTDYWNDRYKAIASTIQTRFPSTTGTLIPVENIQIPDITLARSIDKRARFSVFNPYHRRCARQILDLLLGMPNLNQFLSACVYCREHCNPYMFSYAASIAILHRPDTRSVPLPTHVEIFPELYLDGAVFRRAREEANIVPMGSRMAIEIPLDYTASDLEIEHRIAYWREDVGLNLHHWHWHLVYPFDGPLNIVQKDRRGELFYYMHQQIMARYNFERFSNYLPRTKRLLDLKAPIAEGYFPKLDTVVASRVWPARQPNSVLSDLNRESDQISIDVQDIERWMDRIYNAIHTGKVNNGQEDIPLTEATGIDVLGNIIESSVLSVNRNLYGDMHNMGHIMLSYIHDPDNRHLETFGIMGDPTTAMRDPVFYRWHATVNDIFQEFKSTLPAYTEQQLNFNGIRITGAALTTDGATRDNELQTFFQQNDVDLSRGLDFTPRGSIFARLTHLQHAPFVYRIRVENSGSSQLGTVRIFLAPKLDERGVSFLFRDQRHLFIELDKFTFSLRTGSNYIERRSTDSSATIPFEQTFRSLSNIPSDGAALNNFNYCGCGWPQHLLIPRGNQEGLVCELFFMISNSRDDSVQTTTSATSRSACDDAQSYCGLINSLYPDRRSMGFPFDRSPRAGADILRQFLTPNMFVVDTRIRFTNRIVPSVSSQGQNSGVGGATTTQLQGAGGGGQQGVTFPGGQQGQTSTSNQGASGQQQPSSTRPPGIRPPEPPGRPGRPQIPDFYYPIVQLPEFDDQQWLGHKYE